MVHRGIPNTDLLVATSSPPRNRPVHPPYTLPAEEIAVVDGPAFRAARIRRRFLSRNGGWAAEDYRCTAMGS